MRETKTAPHSIQPTSNYFRVCTAKDPTPDRPFILNQSLVRENWLVHYHIPKVFKQRKSSSSACFILFRKLSITFNILFNSLSLPFLVTILLFTHRLISINFLIYFSIFYTFCLPIY